MKEIDLTTWSRKAHYECFSAYTNPIFSLCTRLDVTDLVRYSKQTGTSYFANFLFIAIKCLNHTEGFTRRILPDGRVVEYETCDPSYIVMNDEGVIVTCRNKMRFDYQGFYADVRSAVEKAKKQTKKEKFNDDDQGVALFYTSCLPWVDFTSMSNPYDLKNPAQSSIPRLTWGKFVQKGERYEMAMDIAAHHALLDGQHLAEGFNKIQTALNDVQSFFDKG